MNVVLAGALLVLVMAFTVAAVAHLAVALGVSHWTILAAFWLIGVATSHGGAA